MDIRGQGTYPVETQVQAPKLKNLRRRDLEPIAIAENVPDAKDLTKDQLLEAMGAQRYLPKTVPMGTDREDAGYEHWEMHGLRKEVKDRGITAANTWKKPDFVSALEEHDRSLTVGGDDAS